MRVLGIDFGDRHIGLAVSDPLLLTAQPLGSYTLTGRSDADGGFFRDLVKKHEIGEIVIGWPLRMNGTSGSRAEKTAKFGAWLEKTVATPVFFMDERLTSRQAQNIIKEEGIREPASKKKREDELSAVIILSTYLEKKRLGKNAP